MTTLEKDTIECWYFENKEDADKANKKKAVAYTKVVNGVLKKNKGEVRPGLYCYIESSTTINTEE